MRALPVDHPWHATATAEALDLLGVDPEDGLSEAEARRRLDQIGPNRIADQRQTPLWRLASNQFRSLVVLLLLSASGIAFVMGERLEAAAILAALLLNAGIGFVSEWRARVSLSRLRALEVPYAIVRRQGRQVQLPADRVVPGDLVLLEAGTRIPADARVVRGASLVTSEAALTGESAPVEKDAEAQITASTPLADRRTMVHLGTTALAGSALTVVTATGSATELGRIGQLVALAGTRATPLERQIERLGRKLMLLALAICVVVAIAGILHGEPIGLMLETAISLAVAAIPEGLPAVTTLALAAGLWRLARAGALVRRLPAVETLGSTTVICTDKTGTLTENQMTVARIFRDGRFLAVTGGGRSASGDFVEEGAPADPATDLLLLEILRVGALVNNAGAVRAEGDSLRLHGDPTESALLVAALKAGLDPQELGRRWPRQKEIPFDARSRFMATVHATPEGPAALLAKGAPEVLLERSARIRCASGDVPLADAARRSIQHANHLMAGEGLRVLAIARRLYLGTNEIPDDQVRGLTFLGLVGIADPPRPEVKDAIRRCREAGIRTFMLTGDQRSTAEAVGRELGLPPEAVVSRASPERKLELIQLLQDQGEVVAMTGDGVNDAPALARADIGVAMGKEGTDVAREAADLVLMDDNFATIVRAVEEGRVIYANLKKVIHFLFSSNLSEIVTIFVAIVLGFPTPLLPLQILWVNLVTDILPAMALIRDPSEPGIMRRPARDPREGLLTWPYAIRILMEGGLLAAGVLTAYFWTMWREGEAGPRAATVAFATIVMIQPMQAMNCRSDRLGWWRLPPNLLTWASLAVVIGAQWLATSWAPLSRVLGTVPLSGADWVLVGAAVVWPVLVLEALKKARPRWSPSG